MSLSVQKTCVKRLQYSKMVQQGPLIGTRLDLIPLGKEHEVGLSRAIDLEATRYLTEWSAPPDFAKAFQGVLDSGRISYAIVLKGGAAVGSTAFFDVRPDHRSLEIGHTWIAKEHRASFVNPEMKFLMLRCAFEQLKCVRVQLKTDGRNLRSQAAMLKLGCTREGLLRQHMIVREGFIRDTAMFSILDAEWPTIKEQLIRRLGYEP